MKAILIDGSFGEGGGQILRTTLALAALTGRSVEIYHIRAGRSRPGLRPQHLTAVRALAEICAAELQGDQLNSQWLAFRPADRPSGGDLSFDVAEAAHGGSAGAISLVAQAILIPLAFAPDTSRVRLYGGTHVPWSPPFHYLRDVFLPAAGRLGLRADAFLQRWGWYPIGNGQFDLHVNPVDRLAGQNWIERGELLQVTGVAAVTNLPAHIPQRMADRARKLLDAAGIASRIEPLRARGPAAGAGIFLTANYAHGTAGFSALGRKGRPAETVAEEACQHLLAHHQDENAPALDPHLADQLLLPLALAEGVSAFITSRITEHTLTNIHVLQRFLDVQIELERQGDGGRIKIQGIGYHV
jgi:RNA 3'-terminal phosphate cyclase (ATP)